MVNNITIQNDEVLTRIFRGYEPQDSKFIRKLIMPTITVTSNKGDIPNVSDNDFLRIHNRAIAGRSGTPEIIVDLSKSSGWSTERYGLKIGVTKKDGQSMNNKDWQAGMSTAKEMFTRLLKKNVLIAQEYATATALFTSATYTNKATLAGADQFNNYSTSDPVGVSQDARKAVRAAIGVPPNVAVMNWDSFLYLANHPQIKRTNGVAPDGTVGIRELTEQEVARALGVDKIFVGSVLYESAKKGVTSSLTDIWAKHILFAYINPNPTPDMFEKSLGYIFESDAVVIDSYVEKDPKYFEYVRSDEEYDEVILDELAGYLVSDAVA